MSALEKKKLLQGVQRRLRLQNRMSDGGKDNKDNVSLETDYQNLQLA